MLRTFIAIAIPPTPGLSRLLGDLHELGTAVRVANPDQLHVTLKFLGDTEETQVTQIAEILREKLKGHEEFLYELRGLGVFPNPKRPSVVWVGLRADPLVELADGLEQRLEELGFPRESRKFEPHLTVARLRGRPPRELTTYLEQNRSTDYGSEIAETVELIQSELSPSGPQYTVLSRVPLDG